MPEPSPTTGPFQRLHKEERQTIRYGQPHTLPTPEGVTQRTVKQNPSPPPSVIYTARHHHSSSPAHRCSLYAKPHHRWTPAPIFSVEHLPPPEALAQASAVDRNQSPCKQNVLDSASPDSIQTN